MKTNKVVKNVLKNTIQIVTIISSCIVISQLKQNKTNEQIAINELKEKITIEEKIAEVTNNEESIQREEEQVTSRHSIARNRQNGNIELTKMLKEEKVEEQQYTKIEDITISKEMDLSITTGISKEDFKLLISNVKYDTSKFFYDNSDYIYDLCQEYQINEIFFCGLISAESGWNIAVNHRRTCNYISLMTSKGLIQYNSVEEGLTAAAKALHNNYLTEGGRFYHGKTLYGVKTKFCPASSTWVDLVYGRMQQIMKCR